MNQEGKSREDLLRDADTVRSKLIHTVEELDRRRHEALDLGLQLRRHAGPLAALGLFAAGTVAAAIALAVQRVSTAALRRRRARWRLVKTVWFRPQRLLRAERLALALEGLCSAGMPIFTLMLVLPARRFAKRRLATTSHVEGRG
jgi:hypothetical protein